MWTWPGPHALRREKARGVDEVFIPIWLQVRPNQFTIESGREIGGDQYLSRGDALFQRVPLQIKASRRYER